MKLISFPGYRPNKAATRAAVISSVFILAWFWSWQGAGLCLFNRITGLQDPGCGMTRAFHAITHGHILDAFGLNLFAVPLFLIMSLVLLNDVTYLARGTQLNWHMSRIRTYRLEWAVLFLLLLYGVLRNVTPLP